MSTDAETAGLAERPEERYVHVMAEAR